ncbi:RES domain-containing protein [Ferrimonas sediminicola]|uniref:RES domain-containing protein n=1 Tax=Ferrimonas sediminicola TaxID=2569538 RepID=A0A4U1B7K5_9GAMM|nr:RES family NAD+ phosphorylase [Ferrimonas sediminicola]TKB46214.1 RES domain-containing protein [Ferrimonas sediminicola]
MAPKTIIKRKGDIFHRVINIVLSENGLRAYDALDPNPFHKLKWETELNPLKECGTPFPGRFSPFKSSLDPVPALYLGATPGAVYFEKIIRPFDIVEGHYIKAAAFDVSERVAIKFEQDLLFADLYPYNLTGPNGNGNWKYEISDIYTTPHKPNIENSRRIAKEIYENYPNLDGIRYQSAQRNNEECFVLFGRARKGNVIYRVSAWEDRVEWEGLLESELRAGRVKVAKCLADACKEPDYYIPKLINEEVSY